MERFCVREAALAGVTLLVVPTRRLLLARSVE
jgi:hypothetical protein